jgi:hypothetical protein
MFWSRIHSHRSLTTLVVLLTAMVMLLGMTDIAQAAPSALGVPKLTAKVILADTSIDGPAIMTTYAPATVLAWTGTDAAHHLNIMTSSDGLHYGNKHILPETSLWRPAVAFIDTGRGAPYGTIVLAWTGTDSHHTLNVEFIQMPEFKVVSKTIFWGEWSFTAPALATVNGDVNSDVYLAWAGANSAHTLNIMRMTTRLPLSGDKHILWGWNSISRPNLARDLTSDSKGDVILSWTGFNNRLYFAYLASDKVHWTMPGSSPLGQQSAWAPSMIGTDSTVPPLHWLAWTGSGTPSTRLINVQYTTHYPNWGDVNSKATLGETAISSPALAYNGHGSSLKVLIAWTGTDLHHHLNVAVVSA